jgi:two-component sensor histidine kinase
MLKMQTRLLEDKTLVDILTQTSNRFLAISSVHEKFYKLESFSGIPIKDFLCDIVNNISHQFEVASDQFEYKITDYSELKINIQTILPLVLIVNELVTNTFKHAYSTNNRLEINIYISNFKENKYQLIYSDNGPGLPPNFSKSNTFGLKLLKLFAEQLHGYIEFNNENGAVFTLSFEYE